MHFANRCSVHLSSHKRSQIFDSKDAFNRFTLNPIYVLVSMRHQDIYGAKLIHWQLWILPNEKCNLISNCIDFELLILTNIYGENWTIQSQFSHIKSFQSDNISAYSKSPRILIIEINCKLMLLAQTNLLVQFQFKRKCLVSNTPQMK